MPVLRVRKFLGGIFTPDFNISNSLKVANTAMEMLGERLDGTPSILPIPQDAPGDIPRILLSSSDKKVGLSVSLQRTNLSCEIPFGFDTGEVDINEYSAIAAQFFSGYRKRLDLRVQRMGFVTERMEVGNDPLKYLLEKFCNKSQIEKGRPFYNAKRFEIHSLKKYEWEGFSINSWVRLKYLPVRMKETEKFEPILLVANDLNTLGSDEDRGANFAESDIERFYLKAPGHIEKILNLYFS